MGTANSFAESAPFQARSAFKFYLFPDLRGVETPYRTNTAPPTEL
jgi:hypothetical protein